MDRKLEYMFRRLLESLGEKAFTAILESIYDLAIIEKEPALYVLSKLESKPGRKSKVKKYLELGNTTLAFLLLEEDLENGLISRRTYFNARKMIKQS